MSKKYYKNNQPTIPEVIIVGIAKMLWWIITLPFKGIKFGTSKSDLSLDERNYIVSERQKIEKTLSSENEVQLKHAVMEADKLVDYALKAKGYHGETFADRLRSAENSMSKPVYNNVWAGHKTRNLIAHEQGLRISNPELSDAVSKLINYLKTI